jgi:hypothetical protein
MSKNKKVKNVKLLGSTIIILLIVASVLGYILNQNHISSQKTNLPDSSALQIRFAYLSQVHTNLCALPTFIDSQQNGSYLQGSCCTFMNFTSYVEQVGGLRNYSNISQIPQDPYNISVSLAKALLSYQNTTLTGAQQETYNEAVNTSTEHGPCCCGCWRWYAFEGLAKYLIVNYNFNASQIANIWDLEDGCGG